MEIIWFMPIICFFSGSLNLEYVLILGRGCLRDQLPIKTLGPESLMGFSGHIVHMLLHFGCWGEKCIPCDPPWEGESTRKPVHGFLTPPASFPLLAQLNYVTVINLSHVYNHTLSSVSLSVNLRVWGGLGGLWRNSLSYSTPTSLS